MEKAKKYFAKAVELVRENPAITVGAILFLGVVLLFV